MQTIPKNTFLQIMRYKKYTLALTTEGIFSIKGLKYYVKFNEIPLRCAMSLEEYNKFKEMRINYDKTKS